MTCSSSLPQFRSVKTKWMAMHEFILPASMRIPRHDHEPPHILIMLGGSLTERLGTTRTCEEGSLRYSPGGDEHIVTTGQNGAHCLVIEARGVPELRLVDRIYVGAEDVASDVMLLKEILYTDGSASPALIEERALGFFALVRERSRPFNATHHEWVRRARMALDTIELSGSPLEEVSRIVGRNPSLVSRAFRAEFGVSIHRCYRRRQLHRAWSLLDSGQPLGAIALEAGFADQSHMTRVFVSEFGVTPAAPRRRMRESSAWNLYLANDLQSFPS